MKRVLPNLDAFLADILMVSEFVDILEKFSRLPLNKVVELTNSLLTPSLVLHLSLWHHIKWAAELEEVKDKLDKLKSKNFIRP